MAALNTLCRVTTPCPSEPLVPVRLRREAGGARIEAAGEAVRFVGEMFRLEADGPCVPHLTMVGRPLVTLSMKVEVHAPRKLRRVVYFAGRWEEGCERVVLSTRLMDNALFLRKNGMSFFLSLDFPFSRIDEEGISYPPHDELRPGVPYACHSLSIGACRLTGEKVGLLDRAEIEALSAYVEGRFPRGFERPMVLAGCITNRMTDCRDGRIFYSMDDNPTLHLSPKLLREDLKVCAEVGVEYYQYFEGVFDWPDPKKNAEDLGKLRREASRVGVRVGDYAVLQGLHCPHYNYDGRKVGRPDWLIVRKDGSTGKECFGCAEYVASFRDRLLDHNRRHRLQLACFDLLKIEPCHAANHGHEPGDLYQQVRALVGICRDLSALDPKFLVWSNSGNWIDLMPKFVWWNPNVYLTDPHARRYQSHLNALQYLGDARREQMVSVHESHGVPYRAFCNCEYYAQRRSRLHDLKVFEYSFLQGLAVTPNLCLGEFRTYLNRIPGSDAARCKAFMRKWLGFVRRHFALWKRTIRVGDAPGSGATEIYAHARGDRGFICLVNQNPFSRVARFRLDGSIGLDQGRAFSLREVYPRKCLLVETGLPFAKWGETVALQVPPRSVRFIEIAPARKQDGPRVLGLSGRVRRTRTGYRAELRAPQGEKVIVGLILPTGQTLAGVAARQVSTVPLYTFPAAARVIEQSGNLARIVVTFPRDGGSRNRDAADGYAGIPRGACPQRLL